MSEVSAGAGAARPAEVCRALLAALGPSDGGTRRPERDTTAGGIGVAIRRELLERTVREDPDPDAFEGWLLACGLARGAVVSAGSVRAIARGILQEWRGSRPLDSSRAWLQRGAPSDGRAGVSAVVCQSGRVSAGGRRVRFSV